jgi:hypothetical protein
MKKNKNLAICFGHGSVGNYFSKNKDFQNNYDLIYFITKKKNFKNTKKIKFLNLNQFKNFQKKNYCLDFYDFTGYINHNENFIKYSQNYIKVLNYKNKIAKIVLNIKPKTFYVFSSIMIESSFKKNLYFNFNYFIIYLYHSLFLKTKSKIVFIFISTVLEDITHKGFLYSIVTKMKKGENISLSKEPKLRNYFFINEFIKKLMQKKKTFRDKFNILIVKGVTITNHEIVDAIKNILKYRKTIFKNYDDENPYKIDYNAGIKNMDFKYKKYFMRLKTRIFPKLQILLKK